MHDLTTQGRGSSATNGDFYIVATKVISQLKLPLILSLGDKVTNASLLGIAGDAPHWQGRLFGTFGFIVRGPAKSSVIFGAEALQEPHHIEGLAAFGGVPVTVPTSLSYFVRVVPRMQRTPLQVDFAVAQLAGKIAPTLDVQARAQMGMGISYHF
jgi:hypothetical protein